MTQKKSRILHVNKLYAPWIGGVERVVQDIAEGLKDEFDMSVLCCQPRGRGMEDAVNGISVIRAASWGMAWGMPFSFDFFRQFRATAPQHDILHFHWPFPLAAIAFVFFRKRLARQRIVVTYHSDIVRQRALEPFVHPFLMRLLSAADSIVVSSPVLAEQSRVLRPFSKKVQVIPFGIRAARYAQTPEILRRARLLMPNDGSRVMLFVGRLGYYKGAEYLIAAMPKVAQHALLWIVGEGPRAKELREFAERIGVASRVEFFGRISDDELKAFYHACDVFVLPSIYASEVFGLVQLEAMACGKPVVNTSLPTGVPWVSQHEVTGLTVPPKDAGALADAINRLLKDDGLRRRLGEAARKRVEEHFSIEKFLKAHQDVYMQLS